MKPIEQMMNQEKSTNGSIQVINFVTKVDDWVVSAFAAAEAEFEVVEDSFIFGKLPFKAFPLLFSSNIFVKI